MDLATSSHVLSVNAFDGVTRKALSLHQVHARSREGKSEVLLWTGLFSLDFGASVARPQD